MTSLEKRIQIQKGIGRIVHEQGAVCRKERERGAGDKGQIKSEWIYEIIDSPK